MSKRWIVLGLLAAAVGVGGLVYSQTRGPAETGKPAAGVEKLYEADPKAAATPAELRGEWVYVQDYPDGTGRKTWRIRFPDAGHAVWTVEVRSAEVNSAPVRVRRTVSFDTPTQVTFVGVERYFGDEPVKLAESDRTPTTWAFAWADKEKAGFTLSRKLDPADDKPTVLAFRKEGAAAADPGVPADLAKIDRTIAKEPKYATGTPGYLLLAVGPEAKRKVWLVWDGDTLYADRDANGDLTDAKDKVPSTPDLPANAGADVGRVFQVGDVGGGVTDLVLSCSRRPGGETIAHLRAEIDGKYVQKTGLMLNGMAATSAVAKVVHLASPTRVLRPSQSKPTVIDLNGKLAGFTAEFGTAGNTLAAFATVAGDGPLAKAHPVATFAFPAAKQGDPPVKVEVTLDQREPTAFGVLDQFVGTLTVPDGVGKGPARVTLSYPNCPLGPVEPREYEVFFKPRK